MFAPLPGPSYNLRVAGPAASISIHPTAVVSHEAELGEGVSVGPYAVVEAGAVLGAGTQIFAHAIVTGFATLGVECQVHFGAVVGHEPQDLGFDGAPSRVQVGRKTIIREYATVHRATQEGQVTIVGDECFLMAHSHVAHDCQLGDRVIVCNSALVAGHCRIGDRAFLSGNTVIHQFCRVGALVMLSGNSGIGRDVGPFLTVASRSEIVGVNSVGMRRAGMSGEARRRVKESYRLLFGAADLREGLDRLKDSAQENSEVRAICEFYAGSRRGFSRPPQGHVLGDAAEDA